MGSGPVECSALNEKKPIFEYCTLYNNKNAQNTKMKWNKINHTIYSFTEKGFKLDTTILSSNRQYYEFILVCL